MLGEAHQQQEEEDEQQAAYGPEIEEPGDHRGRNSRRQQRQPAGGRIVPGSGRPSPGDREEYERVVRLLEERTDEASFVAWLAEGKALGWEDGIAYALGSGGDRERV